jgi:hypothetical protein
MAKRRVDKKSELVLALKEIGVRPYTIFGNWKSVYQIFNEISRKWDKLDKYDRDDISEYLAGKKDREEPSLLLNQFTPDKGDRIIEKENKVRPICSNCRYCHGEEGYDQQWGRFLRIHAWCDIDRNRMDSWVKNNQNDYWFDECDLFEFGQGQYDEIPEKIKKTLPH